MGIRRSSQGCVSVLNRITDNTLLAGLGNISQRDKRSLFRDTYPGGHFYANKCAFESAALGYLSEPELSPSS